MFFPLRPEYDHKIRVHLPAYPADSREEKRNAYERIHHLPLLCRGARRVNLDYFLRAGMAVTGDTPEKIADLALHLAHDEKKLSAMRRTMQAANARPAAEAIYDWLQAHHE